MNTQLSGRILAAARALAGISSADLASASGLEIDRLQLLEAEGAAWLPQPDAERLLATLEDYGVIVLPEGDGMGAGVRLKFTRLDTKQIGRLENEGGPTRPDDVP